MESYVDHVTLRRCTKEIHVIALEKAFVTLKKYIMKLKLKKCMFGVQSKTFPGDGASPKKICVSWIYIPFPNSV